MTRAEQIQNFMTEAHAKGMTVYFSTHLRVIKVAAKHAQYTRIKGDHFEVLQGKQGYVSVNYTKITAA